MASLLDEPTKVHRMMMYRGGSELYLLVFVVKTLSRRLNSRTTIKLDVSNRNSGLVWSEP